MLHCLYKGGKNACLESIEVVGASLDYINVTRLIERCVLFNNVFRSSVT